MTIDEHILYLLLRHDCLIIPDFGGFVARTSSAQIDWQKNQITPPRKDLIFNSLLQKNDGLLLASIVEKNSLSYTEAQVLLQQTQDEWKRKLSLGQRVEIEKVGYLFKGVNGNILFEQDRFYNLLLSTYGLSDVHFIPASSYQKTIVQAKKNEDEVSEERPILNKKPLLEQIIQMPKPVYTVDKNDILKNESTPLETQKVPPLRKPGHHFPWRSLAAAALIPIGFFAYWIPMKTQVLETGMISIADFNPFRSFQAPSYNPVNMVYHPTKAYVEPTFDENTKHLAGDVNVYHYKFNDELYIPIKLDVNQNTLGATEKQIVHNETKPNIAAKNEEKFHLIGGCFSSEENAKNFVNDCIAKQKNAFVFDYKNGLYRVSVAQSSTIEEIQELKSALMQEGLDTWILRK